MSDIRNLRSGKKIKLPEPKRKPSKNPSPTTPLSNKIRNQETEEPLLKKQNLSQNQDQNNHFQSQNPNLAPTRTTNLYDLYTNLYYPHGFTGSSRNIKETLNTFSGYSLHKPRRKNFKRRRTFVPGPFHSVQSDLIEYSNNKMAHANNNYRFILIIIDCFTKKVYGRPLKSKKAVETSKAIDDILSSLPWPVAFFSSDKGGEFDLRNPHIQNVLVKKHRVQAFTLSGKTKASIVERVIRTLKTRFARYFTESGTTRWINILESFINNYNNTYNRSIKMTPNDVTLENADQVRNNLYGQDNSKPDCKLKLNDLVRIPLEKNLFAKGYERSWSTNTYLVSRIQSSHGVCYFHGKFNVIK